MKILHVIETLGRGGAEGALVNLLPELQKRGNQCEVAVLMPPYELIGKLEDAGIVVHCLDLNYRWNLVASVKKLIALCRRGKFDIVHAHLFFAAIITALSHPFTPATKKVVTFHNLAFDSHPANTVWKKMRKRMEGWLMRHWMDGWIGVSKPVSKHYEMHLRLSQVAVIPNALPESIFHIKAQSDRSALLSKYGVRPTDFVIIMPGRLTKEKGHQFLLEAILLLRERALCPKVLIFGDGPLNSQMIREIENMNLGNQITLSPSLPQEKLFPLIHASDIVVMPSLFEGFGLIAIEAMALGKPVIATRVGGLQELIVDGVNGLLVLPANPDVLANGIERLIRDNDLRERISHEGRKSVEKCFKAFIIADELERYYNDLLIAH